MKLQKQLKFALNQKLSARHVLALIELRKRHVLGDSMQPGPTELAKACGCSNAAMTQILDKLHDRGLIEKTHGSTDRRRIKTRISAAGHEFMEQIENV